MPCVPLHPPLASGGVPEFSAARIYSAYIVDRYASGQGRLPEVSYFSESDFIFDELRVGSVHEDGYGHNWDGAAA
jgi:hypothetical protein